MGIDLPSLKEEGLLKLYEVQWKDHHHARTQTWQALHVTGIVAVALIGIQWKSGSVLVGCLTSVVLILVSFFGMQITMRHRNSVEIKKFEMICAIEERLGLRGTDFSIPDRIGWRDIYRVNKSNTSLFLIRMQCVIFFLGWILLLYGGV